MSLPLGPGGCRVQVAAPGGQDRRERTMGDVIVIQFSTLDGVVSDPDGRWGSGYGGWAFRHGQEP